MTRTLGRAAFQRYVTRYPGSTLVGGPRFGEGVSIRQSNGWEGVFWPNGSSALLTSLRSSWRGHGFDRYAILGDLGVAFPTAEAAPAFMTAVPE